MAGFYAAFAYTGLCDDSDAYCSHGAIKGMLLRHLRWWATHSQNIFWADGTLNIGYLYPNMYMSEHYNSPQSPYWAVKSLIVIALAEDDPFWAAEPIAHPLAQCARNNTDDANNASDILVIEPSRQVVCNHAKGNHHFMLSSGQFCVWSMKATEAKYAKFAYSSAFAFSVPTGPLLSQIAPDSCLALSRDDGETWRVRWKTIGETEFVTVPLDGPSSEQTAALVSRWRPWKNEEVEIETTLVAPCHRWPDWHVRVHRIQCSDNAAVESLTTVEGGFAIDGENTIDGRMIQPHHVISDGMLPNASSSGFATESSMASLVVSAAGASGVVDLSASCASMSEVKGEMLTPDPNTNLVSRRTLIPTIKHIGKVEAGGNAILATAVFAVSFSKSKSILSQHEIQRRWTQRPSFIRNTKSGKWILS